MNRNIIGSPSAFLRSGLSTPDVGPIPAQEPPFGTGSLNLVVSGQPTTPAGQEEKVAYGNEVDFVGDLFEDLTAVGFHVYTTDENAGIAAPATCRRSPWKWIPTGKASEPTSRPSSSFRRPIVPLVWSDYIDATAEGRLGRHRFGVRRHAVRHRPDALCTFAELQDVARRRRRSRRSSGRWRSPRDGTTPGKVRSTACASTTPSTTSRRPASSKLPRRTQRQDGQKRAQTAAAFGGGRRRSRKPSPPTS